jgi:hypothetical protein
LLIKPWHFLEKNPKNLVKILNLKLNGFNVLGVASNTCIYSKFDFGTSKFRVFLLSTYEIKKFYHVLGLLTAKKHVLGEKKVTSKINLRYWSKFVSTISQPPKGYRFEISVTLHHLGWIDAPHTQES